MPLSTKAGLKLNIVVIGGGIGGLAAAFRLSKAGHNVRVFEKAKSQEKAYGVRVPPNLTKTLDEWGLRERLAQLASQVNACRCYSMETGEVLGDLVWQSDVFREMGAQFLVVHYQDLHEILYTAAESAGIQVSYNITVTKVSANPPRVELASGETVYPDLIIGADGPQSIVRLAVEGKPNDGHPSEDNFTAFVTVIPRARLETDSELNAFTRPSLGGPQSPIWLTTSCHAVGFALRDESEFALIVFVSDSLMDDESKRLETMSGKQLRIPGNSNLRRLLDLCPTLQRMPYVRRDFPSEWIDDSRRIILIGDAAHPSMPCVPQDASLDIEDAEILGWLMSRLQSWEELPYFLQAFQDLRRDRCLSVHTKEVETLRLAWLPPGPTRDERNAVLWSVMTLGPDDWDNAMMRHHWEDLSGVLAYNAREAVENWWVSWGVLRERSESVSFASALAGPSRESDTTRE